MAESSSVPGRVEEEPVTVGQLGELAGLFWPEFVEVRGCVLLAERYDPEDFSSWWNQTSGNVRAIEGVVNETHLYDLVRDDDIGEERLGRLYDAAQRLAACWRAALAVRFPDRRVRGVVWD